MVFLRKQKINSIIWIIINFTQSLYDRAVWLISSYFLYSRLKADGVNKIEIFNKKNWHHGARYFIGEFDGKKVFIKNAKKREIKKELFCLYKMKIGVCQVFSFNLSIFTSYMVIEYVDGIPLTDYLSNKTSINETVEIVKKLEAIACELIDNNIVHRDLRPDNLFVTFNGEVKVIDFALSVEGGFFQESYLNKVLKLKGLCADFKPGLYTWSDVYSINRMLDPYGLEINVSYCIFYKC